MGSNFDYDWGTINQAFAAGQVGMYMGGSDVYNSLVQNNGIEPDDYGLTVIPLDGARRRRARRRHARRGRTSTPPTAERDAAVKWIDFYYMEKLLDPGGRRRRRRGARGQQPAGRRAGAADLRQGHARRVPGLDRGLHQRAARRR